MWSYHPETLQTSQVLAHEYGRPQSVQLDLSGCTAPVSPKSLSPPPEFLAPPPGGPRADLPARAAVHRHLLSFKVSQYNGALSALRSPEQLIFSHLPQHPRAHSGPCFGSRKQRNSANDTLTPEGTRSKSSVVLKM